MKNEVQDLFEWIMEHAGLLPTTITLSWIGNKDCLKLRFTGPISGADIEILKSVNDLSVQYQLSGTLFDGGPKEILDLLKASVQVSSFRWNKTFVKQSKLLCETYPLYLGQLLARKQACDEFCRLASNTITYMEADGIRNLINYTIYQFLDPETPLTGLKRRRAA